MPNMLAERRPAEASTVTAPPPAVTAPAASPALRLGPLPLRALNHVSLCVRDVAKSAAFYQDVLGFTEVRRPSCFDFDGSWLFGYGLGLHLIHGEPQERPATINPRGDHLSFQADDLADVQARLAAAAIPAAREAVTEAGLVVTQLFFHDPDRNMIEVCDCHALPTVALDGTVIQGAAACAMRAAVEAGGGGEVGSGRPCSAALAVAAGGSPPPPPVRVRGGSPVLPSPMAGLTPHLPLEAGPAIIAAARARAGLASAGCECGAVGEHGEHGHGDGSDHGGDDTPGGGDSAGTACEMLLDGSDSGGGGGGGESSGGRSSDGGAA